MLCGHVLYQDTLSHLFVSSCDIRKIDYVNIYIFFIKFFILCGAFKFFKINIGTLRKIEIGLRDLGCVFYSDGVVF